MNNINIENIVASAQISSSFDIETLSEKLPGSSYNPDEFDGLTIKFETPKIAVLILSNGKAICTGGKNQEESKDAMNKTVKKIKDAGFEAKTNFKTTIENIILSTDFNKMLNLESISKGLYFKHVDYNPKDFPGLIYRAEEYNSVLILFSSGRLVCTGAKKIDDGNKAINKIKEKLTSIGAL